MAATPQYPQQGQLSSLCTKGSIRNFLLGFGVEKPQAGGKKKWSTLGFFLNWKKFLSLSHHTTSSRRIEWMRFFFFFVRYSLTPAIFFLSLSRFYIYNRCDDILVNIRRKHNWKYSLASCPNLQKYSHTYIFSSVFLSISLCCCYFCPFILNVFFFWIKSIKKNILIKSFITSAIVSI